MSAEQMLARIRWLDEMLKQLQRTPSTKETRHQAGVPVATTRVHSTFAHEAIGNTCVGCTGLQGNELYAKKACCCRYLGRIELHLIQPSNT
jgi:hypothetical protein